MNNDVSPLFALHVYELIMFGQIALQVWIDYVIWLIVLPVSIKVVSWIMALYEWFDDKNCLIALVWMDDVTWLANCAICLNWWCF